MQSLQGERAASEYVVHVLRLLVTKDARINMWEISRKRAKRMSLRIKEI